MAADIFANSPETDLRRRWALLQMQMGADASPVDHPMQAVARALQGAMGGYVAGKAASEDKAAGAAMFSSLPGLGSPQVAAPAAAPEAAPMAAPATMQPMGNTPVAGNDMSVPRGLRNNNPLNIEAGNFTQGQPGFSGSDGRFAKFASMEGGVGAANKLLDTYQNKHGLNTVNGILSRWAPTSDGNNVSAYAQNVSKQLGIDPNAPIPPEMRPQLIAAMAKHENGRPIDLGQVQAALQPQGQPQAPVTPQQPGVQVAQAQNPPAPNRASTQIPPDVQATIQKLGADPRTRGQAWQLYLQYAKPTEQYQTYETGGQRVQRNLTTGKEEASPTNLPESLRVVNEMMANPAKYGFKGPDDPELMAAARQKLSGMQNSVTVNNAANPVLEGVGKQIVSSREKASSASNVIPMIHDARRVLDDGAVTGAGADFRVSLQKVGALFGMDASQASNAEVFKSVVGNEVLGSIKALGANPSNADRSYIEKIMGGEIALEEKSLRKILDIQEKYARQSIGNFNRDSKKLMDANPEAYRSIAPLMNFDMPGEYQMKAPGSPGAAPGAPAAPTPPGSPVKVTSPDEARRLPKGTPIILPDGSRGVVP